MGINRDLTQLLPICFKRMLEAVGDKLDETPEKKILLRLCLEALEHVHH